MSFIEFLNKHPSLNINFKNVKPLFIGSTFYDVVNARYASNVYDELLRVMRGDVPNCVTKNFPGSNWGAIEFQKQQQLSSLTFNEIYLLYKDYVLTTLPAKTGNSMKDINS